MRILRAAPAFVNHGSGRQIAIEDGAAIQQPDVLAAFQHDAPLKAGQRRVFNRDIAGVRDMQADAAAFSRPDKANAVKSSV